MAAADEAPVSVDTGMRTAGIGVCTFVDIYCESNKRNSRNDVIIIAINRLFNIYLIFIIDGVCLLLEM